MSLMSQLRAKYSNACTDQSGYAEAGRSYILSLLAAGVKITINPFSFESYKPSDVGHQDILSPYYHKPLDYKFNIIHMTPDHLPRLYEGGKYNISLSVWETDRLPSQWVNYINRFCEETWVPSRYCKDVWIDSGVKKEVFVMEHAIDTEQYFSSQVPWKIDGVTKEDFVFYSIFQWSERKNAAGFIESYLSEFNRNEKVVLLLKTFLKDYSPRDAQHLKMEITKLKDKVGKGELSPKIYLVHGPLTRTQVNSIHILGDCLVSSFRSEGVGLPLVEAALASNGVISPRCTGIVDYLPESHTYYYKADKLIPAGNMNNISNLYTANMKWHDPDIKELQNVMRHVFEHQDEVKSFGTSLKSHIKNNFNFTQIGNKMVNRLREIQ